MTEIQNLKGMSASCLHAWRDMSSVKLQTYNRQLLDFVSHRQTTVNTLMARTINVSMRIETFHAMTLLIEPVGNWIKTYSTDYTLQNPPMVISSI